MKQTVTTQTTFKIIIAFTLLFAAFLALAITYNKAYKLKNETITIIEKYEGMTDNTMDLVNSYLSNSGYNTKNNCDIGEYGVYDLKNNLIEEVTTNNKKYFYCMQERCSIGNCQTLSDKNKIIYNFKLFFRFNLPFISELVTFPITGETKSINYYDLDQSLAK